MKIRITKGTFQGIRDAEPCAHPNHAARPAHLTITVFGGPWCIFGGEYEVAGKRDEDHEHVREDIPALNSEGQS